MLEEVAERIIGLECNSLLHIIRVRIKCNHCSFIFQIKIWELILKVVTLRIAVLGWNSLLHIIRVQLTLTRPPFTCLQCNFRFKIGRPTSGEVTLRITDLGWNSLLHINPCNFLLHM